MTELPGGLVTILFTDLVGSTELLSRAGDEDAQRIFRAHHDLLSETAAAYGGDEVKWLGDGLMVAFASAARALRAAVAMQRASRRPVRGERLAIRVGLNAGEALRDAGDYFGTPVVVARRLCDGAEAGQILCTETVRGLLSGQREFAFASLGPRELKGVPEPVAVCALTYEAQPGDALAVHVPMVGREAELNRLVSRLGEAADGRGGLVLVAGEPGIGKTRMLSELMERAKRLGATVIAGRCYESEWSPPYGPFAEALAEAVAAGSAEELAADLGTGAAPLAALVPRIRDVVPGVEEPAPVGPGEERFRLFDATARFLLARAQRSTVLLCLDDLHWIDAGSVAMLRHLARFAPEARILLAGTYRDAEVGPGHPLAEALGTLPRESVYDNVHLVGLSSEAVAELLGALGEQDVSASVGAAWAAETAGNPFFLQELVRHFVEEGKLFRDADGRWATTGPLSQLGIPTGVRGVVRRRLARLSPAANRLVEVASAFEGLFPFAVVAGVADLDEGDALDALDEALTAQLLVDTDIPDTFDFVHNLIRHAVYGELSSARRLRLHRRVAEALASSGAPPGDVAGQYHLSRGLPGAEAGVDPALAAADAAEATGAHGDAARFLRLALEILPPADGRRPRLLARLGITLAWALAFDDAVATAREAADAIGRAEGDDSAAAYLAEAALACGSAGSNPHAWNLARAGLPRAGDRRDVSWALLVSFDHERRAAEDPELTGIPIDTPERRRAAAIFRAVTDDPLGIGPLEAVWDSRKESDASPNLIVWAVWRGDYQRALPRLVEEAERNRARGQLARAIRAFQTATVCAIALGQLAQAQEFLEHCRALADRSGLPLSGLLHARERLATTVGTPDPEVTGAYRAVAGTRPPGIAWMLGMVYSHCAVSAAREALSEEAIDYLGRTVPWLERAPAWTIAYSVVVHDTAETLWDLERLDHIDVVERAARDKVVAADFRCSMADGRLTMARLCSLQDRHDEALHWLAEARCVLEEQGARPLLAIADLDEARMWSRRGDPAETKRAVALLDSARAQFVALGMTGWSRRADELEGRLA